MIEKKQKRKLSSSNTVTFAPTDAEGAAVVSAVTALAPPVTPVSPFPTFTYLPGMPGPAKLCRPMWPSFMINSECREPVSVILQSYNSAVLLIDVDITTR